MNIEDIQSVLGLIKIYLSTSPSALCPSTQCHRFGSFGKEIDLFFSGQERELLTILSVESMQHLSIAQNLLGGCLPSLLFLSYSFNQSTVPSAFELHH